MKLSIIGHCGSGKTTLAKKIAQRSNVPRLELDRLFFELGGNDVPRSDVAGREMVGKHIHEAVTTFLAEHTSWVSDGLYPAEQAAIANSADEIVYIDIPLWRRQYNHLTRILLGKDRHPEISLTQDLHFTWDMIRRTKKGQPHIEELCRNYTDKLTVLNSYKAVDAFFEDLK